MLKDFLKELFKHSSIYSIGLILTSFLSIILLPVYTKYLTPSDYGILSLCDLFKSFSVLIVMCGIQSAFTRYYHYYDDNRKRLCIYNTALIFSLCVDILLFLITFSFSSVISYYLLGTYKYKDYIRIISFVFLFLGIKNINLAYFATNKQSILRTIFQVLISYLGAFLTLLMLIYYHFGIKSFLYSDLIVSILVVIISLYILFQKVNFRLISFSYLKSMLQYGIPLVPALIFANFMHNIDQYLLRLFKGLNIVGIYAIAYKFPFMLNNLFLVSLNTIWGTALIYDIAKNKNSDYIFSRIATYCMLVYIYGMFCLSVMSPIIVKLLVAKEYLSAYKYIPIICLGLVPYAFHSFLSVGVKIKLETWYIPITFFVGCLSNLILNYFLIPKYGAIGASWSTFFSYSIFAIVSYILYSRSYKITFEWNRLSKLLIIAILLYLVSEFLDIKYFIIRLIIKIFICISFPIILYISNFFTNTEKIYITNFIFKVKRNQ